MGRRPIGELKRLASGRWVEVLGRICPELAPAIERVGRHVPCPVHGGKGGFRLYRDVEATGGGCCNTCGAFPNGVDLVAWLTSWPLAETCGAIARALGAESGADSPRPMRRTTSPKPQESDLTKARKLAATWRACCPLTDASAVPAQRYIQRRVPALHPADWPADLRFQRAMPYYDADGRFTGTHPAMVARVADPAGRGVTLHVTYLTDDGRKANVQSPKKLLSPLSPGATAGAAIRLCAVGEVLAVAEGIETALAIHAASGVPAWATVSANGMRTLVVPEHVREVYVCADHDVSGVGQAAGLALSERLAEEGRIVRLVVPPHPGQDWNDYTNAGLADVE